MEFSEVCGVAFDDMDEAEMEDIFGGTRENIQPNFTTIFIPVSVKVSAVISGSISAISGIVSYNQSCLG